VSTGAACPPDHAACSARGCGNPAHAPKPWQRLRRDDYQRTNNPPIPASHAPIRPPIRQQPHLVVLALLVLHQRGLVVEHAVAVEAEYDLLLPLLLGRTQGGRAAHATGGR
jgi:hypothetical protein